MTVKDYNLVKIRERENFHGKKERTVFINCKKCPKYTGALLKTKRCVSCLLEILFKFKRKKFAKFSLDSENNSLRKDKIKLFLDYFKSIKEMKIAFKSIDSEINKKCQLKDICEVFAYSVPGIIPSDINFKNPIELYDTIYMRYKNLKKKTIKHVSCNYCKRDLIANYSTFLNILVNQSIIKDYLSFTKKCNLFPAYLKYYQNLFSLPNNIERSKQKEVFERKVIEKSKPELIDSYQIGKNGLFKILIYNIQKNFEKLYEVNLTFKTESEQSFFKKIAKDVKNYLIDAFRVDGILSFEELIEKFKNEGINYIANKYKLSDVEKERISLLATFDAINLAKLFPLLLDDHIEEIFLDSNTSRLYINHQLYSRCCTDLQFTEDEIERLKTFIRLYSGQRLDYSNPSVKFVMKNKLFFCRFAVDIAPIHAFNFSLDIRKLNKNIFTIQDLLKKKTLNPLMASFLYFNIIRRNNITVTGETDTGKTTLINALDLLLPKEFRKIYIENAIESLNQNNFDKHQLKYQVDSLEDDIGIKFSKSNQIKKLLHRSPDIIYLGEILTKEEAEAMFHCLSAGLRGFQTIHANTIESLVNRFLHHFDISPSCLNDLDLLILMKKDSVTNERKVIHIAEIDSSKNIEYLFTYNPNTNIWDSIKGDNLYNSKSVQKLTKHEKLDKESFWRYLNVYKQIFEVFTKVTRLPNNDLVDFFHEISFISKFGLQKLEDFWSDWKNELNKCK